MIKRGSTRLMTSSKAWFRLYENGPMTARALADLMNRRRMPIYKALGYLMEKGKVYRFGDVIWHRQYAVVPGSVPPDDLRGQHPNSRAALQKHRAIPASSWFQPCDLAQCWQLLPVSRAKSDGVCLNLPREGASSADTSTRRDQGPAHTLSGLSISEEAQ